MKPLHFVIVGHIDHGKSTLIGRLLYETNTLSVDKIREIAERSIESGKEMEFAFFLDHFKEERSKGITIDISQTYFRTEKREYMIIDAPGHREFLKNMITGATQAEAGVLIVDVSEGIKEQTKRHAYILSLLGINQIIVVLNKMDLINYKKEKYEEVKSQLIQFLEVLGIRPKCFIPTSALKGENVKEKSKLMSWYDRLTFLESLDTLEVKTSLKDKELIFPIQDIYNFNDENIIVGKIESGKIKRGQEIKILPSNRTAKIKSIKKYLENPFESYAGESTGVILENDIPLKRGAIICDINSKIELNKGFSANIFWFDKQELYVADELTLKCSTQKNSVKIERIIERIDSSKIEIIEKEANYLKNLEIGNVYISTEDYMFIKPFSILESLGRFILLKNGNVCAGGIVIEPK